MAIPREGRVESLGYRDIPDDDFPGGTRRKWLGKITVSPATRNPQEATRAVVRERDEQHHGTASLMADVDMSQPDVVVFGGDVANIFTLFGTSTTNPNTVPYMIERGHAIAAQLAIAADEYERQNPLAEGVVSIGPEYTSVLPAPPQD